MKKENVILYIIIAMALTYIVTSKSKELKPSHVVNKEDSKLTSELENVKQEFSKIESKEDKVLIYKLFSGAGDYLVNAKKLTATSQFDPVLGRVQNSYGWNREKYPKFTDAVSAYLKSVDYQTPKKIESESDRTSFAKIFKSLAEVTKYE